MAIGSNQRARAQFGESNCEVVDVGYLVASDAIDNVSGLYRIGAYFRVPKKFFRPVKGVFGKRFNDEHVGHHEEHGFHAFRKFRVKPFARRRWPTRHQSQQHIIGYFGFVETGIPCGLPHLFMAALVAMAGLVPGVGFKEAAC